MTNKTNTSNPPLVFVQWVDSIADIGWKVRDDTRTEPDTCCSVGWLLRKDRGSLTLASSRDSGFETFASHITIPMGAVTEIRPLKAGRKQ